MLSANALPTVFEDGRLIISNPYNKDVTTTLASSVPVSFLSREGISPAFDDPRYLSELLYTDKENAVIALSGCFPASAKTVLTPLSNSAVCNDTPVSETVKTAENDSFHLTLNDNATFIISDKSSGNIYFEMLTCFLSHKASPTCTKEFLAVPRALSKTRAGLLSAFEATLKARDADFRVCAVLGKNDVCVRFSASLSGKLGENEHALLRLPTGAYLAQISIQSANGSSPAKNVSQNETLTLEAGDTLLIEGPDAPGFTFTPLSASVCATVRENGDLDVLLYPEEHISFAVRCTEESCM